MTGATGPLVGLRVLEIGHFVAAPFAARLLGDLGASVVKIEPPGGDPVRGWGRQRDGQSIWWSVHGRNKRSITLDLKTAPGLALARDLAARADVLIENFRPGQLARMGLDDASLRAANPGLIIAHVSGYGQDGPDAGRSGFGAIGEAIGGLRHLTDHPAGTTGLPPVRVGVSIGDSVAGLYAALGVLAALWQRDRQGGTGRGQPVDVALTEAILSLMEGVLPEYGALGAVRQPVGSRIPTTAPSNAYPDAQGRWVIIAANSDPLFARLSQLMGRPDLPQDPRFATNAARVAHDAALDAIIADWTRQQDGAQIEAALETANIPASRIFDAADIAANAQFRARGMVRSTRDPLLGEVLHPGIVPHLPESPGGIRLTGPAPGADAAIVLAEWLGQPAGVTP